MTITLKTDAEAVGTGGSKCPSFLEALIAKRRVAHRIPVAVCWPGSAVSLQGALEASDAGLIEPLLVGCRTELAKIAAMLGKTLDLCEIIDASNQEDAAARSVELCSTGRAVAIMKGSLHTDVLMHRVVQESSGIRMSGRMSHVFVVQVPLCERPLLITDAAVNIYPDLETKVDIIRNAIELARVLGISEPKVAILSAVETVETSIRSTIDAAALSKMADRRQITGALIDGPLAFDTAVSPEAARIKGILSPVAGRADILVVPDLESGNMLAKQIEYLGNGQLAGIVVGTKFPIILTSRADYPESRIASCAIASQLIADKQRKPYGCPCCGCRTLDERGGMGICPVCYWEDDGQGDQDAGEFDGGSNGAISLAQARKNFLRFGACDESHLKFVRPPIPEELP